MNKKELKQLVKEALKNNDYQCSVSIADIDSNVTAFANLRGAKVSWEKTNMIIFVPGEITFEIPYARILRSHRNSDKQLELVLEKRSLVSIREAFETRRRA